MAAHEGHLDAEDLEPSEQPVQCRLIGEPALQYGLRGLLGEREILVVEQSLWRECACDPDFIMMI